MANDNAPAFTAPRGDAVGFNAMLRERQKQRQEASSGPQIEDFIQKNNLGLWLSVIIWAGFGAGVLWAFYSSQPTGTRIFSSIGFIWSGLWTRFLALDHDKPRMAEMCLLSSLLGFLSLMVTATVQMGYPLSLPAGLMIFIAAALLASLINKSITALICAIAGSLFWAALQIDGYLESGIFNLAVPAILALTILQAIRLKSGMSVLVAAAIGYIWIAGTSFAAFNNGQISALFLLTGAAVLGNVHYRAAKAAEDEKLGFTAFQTACGWIVANTSLLILAKYALDPADPIWAGMDQTSSIARLSWLSLMGLGIFVYFIAGFIRKRHNHMSLAGVVLTSLLLMALPFAALYLPSLEAFFTRYTQAPLYPHAGLFLFGAVTGNIMFFISNAFRRHHYFKVVISLFAIAALSYVAAGIDLVHQEYWVTWLIGTFASILIALIAVEPQLAPEEDPDMRVSVSTS